MVGLLKDYKVLFFKLLFMFCFFVCYGIFSVCYFVCYIVSIKLIFVKWINILKRIKGDNS